MRADNLGAILVSTTNSSLYFWPIFSGLSVTTHKGIFENTPTRTGQSRGTRTPSLSVPNGALYQIELYPGSG